MRFLSLFATGLVALVLFFVSSARPVGFSGLPVTKIILKDDRGNPWPKPELLMPLIVHKPGAPYSSSDIRKSIEYLYLKGLFKDVRVEAFPDDGGARIEYTLVPITVVQKIRIHGNHEISTGKIREALGEMEGRELRAEKLPEIKANVQALYQAEGFYETRIKFRQEQTGEPHQAILHVDITESEPTLIEDIDFIGNTVFTDEELREAMKSRKGKPLRRDLLLDTDMQAILQKYADAGYPAARQGVVNMSFRDRKAYIAVSGSEGPKVAVAFTGNHEFSSRRLSRNLLIWSEHDVSDSVIESSMEKIKNLYREKGYVDVKVDVKKIETPGRLGLEFRISEGPKVSVKEIRIEGNAVFTIRELKKQMMLREPGWFRSQPYREDVLEKDVENIRDRYIDGGYLDVSVEKKVMRSADGHEASVFLTIAEGQKTTVGTISFEGNTAFTNRELLEKLNLKPGTPFSERLMEEDRYRILSAYSSKGYLYAKVEAERKLPETTERSESEGNKNLSARVEAKEKAPTRKTEDIRYRIFEDQPVSLGRIILRGNERTKDHVILRELLVKPGDTYNYEAILGSQQRIYRLGYFGLARFESVRPGEKEYVKDMLLTVEERPAGAVEFGFGYGDLDRFRGFVEGSYRNLGGSARYVSLRFEGSDILQRGIFNFHEPWFLGRKLENRFSLVWSDTKKLNQDTHEIYYQTRKATASFGVEKVHDGLKTSLIYQYENVENYNVASGAVITPEDIGRVRISSLTPGLIWDLRDNPFNPRTGSLHGIAAKEAMSLLGSEADFTKITVQTSWFFPLGEKVVTAVSARAGMARPHKDTVEVPLHERFYLGGGTTVRGYRQDSVGPVGLDGITPTGGSSMVLFNAELRINPFGGLGLVFFTDAGNVWPDQKIQLDNLRASYGAGIRYNTPVGPLRVDYGQKIHRRPGESPGEIHFSIGHAF